MMSWTKYIVAFIASTIMFLITSIWRLPVSNDATWIGICVMSAAFIAYQEK